MSYGRTNGIQCSKPIYPVVESFQNNREIVHREELEALNEDLKSLHETTTNISVDFPALKLPKGDRILLRFQSKAMMIR
jgi:hypothetical protein